MSGGCGHKDPNCGCKDSPLTTNLQCAPEVPCENPETCAQIWDAHCIIWNGPDIVDLDINKGDRLDEILQKLVLNGMNPGCIDPTSTCQSVLNLVPLSIGPNSITVGWSASPTAVTYQVEYREASAMSWTLNAAIAVGINQDSIGPLLPNTEYYIRVNAQCGSGSCYSLTIKVKTNP